MTFSSPSGDGLVPHELGLNDIESWFSSPSGDGLVLEKRKDVKNMKKNFSSPLGDGLVPYRIQLFQHIMLFSSPLGDGLVPVEGNKVGHNGGIFVPEWGWVGSQQSVCLPL